MPFQTVILFATPGFYSWVPPHGRHVTDAGTTVTIPGDLFSYYTGKRPGDLRALEAIRRAFNSNAVEIWETESAIAVGTSI